MRSIPHDVEPGRGRFLSGSYSNQAGSRTYKVYVPSAYHGQAIALIVMLHGGGQSADDFAAGTRMNALGEEGNILVAYPEQAAAANISKCWNWYSPRDQQRGQGEPSLIAGITQQIMRDYRVAPRGVYVAGFSAGAATAAVMATAYCDLYCAVGVHSGLACGAASDISSALLAMQQGDTGAPQPGNGSGVGSDGQIVRAIVFHGDCDSMVHPANADRVVAQFAPVGLQATVHRGQVPGGHSYSRTVYTDASGRALVERWLVHGAGHAWFGGSPSGSYTDPRGPDAAREMVRFFLERADDRPGAQS